jgi:hypothetical protein
MVMTKLDTPPPAIDGARLLAYAFVDDSVTYDDGKSTLYVDGVLLKAVPRLAICELLETRAALLFFCDKDWNSLGVTEHDSVESAKKRAENEYHGIAAKWVTAKVTKEDAINYMEEQFKDQQCSFCGKLPDEVQQVFASSSACICSDCVAELYQQLGSN